MKFNYLMLMLLAGILSFTSCGNKAEEQEDDSTEVLDEGTGMEIPTDVSDEDLRAFAYLMAAMGPISEAAQMKMFEAIESEGLALEKYIEIQTEMSSNPDAPEVAEGDKTKFEKASKKVADITKQNDQEMNDLLEQSGMSLEKYQG
ncbi:MAG: hypothetical protein P5697_25845, partial [Limnospira sp. PMC 1256.20]|uniref:DUF4168 domain-containing protein n=1 Tax=Limnospira sp. PMC 1256.20 TaxID=2981054 RepID=UPI0028E151DF